MSECRILVLDEAMDRVGGDLELYHELVELLFSELEEGLQRIGGAIETSSCLELEHGSHAIKSAFGNVGAMECYDIAFALEKLGKSGALDSASDQYDELKAAISRFEKEYEKVEKAPA